MQLSSLMSLLSLIQVNDLPTRITSASESLLDLILVSSGRRRVRCDTFDISDHCAVYAVLGGPSRRSWTFLYRNVRSIPSDLIVAELSQIHWMSLFNFTYIDTIFPFLNRYSLCSHRFI